MKKLATLLTLMSGVGMVFGQGVLHNPGAVSFQNTETARPAGTPISYHIVTNGTTGLGLTGTQFKAELYYMDTDLNSLMPIPASISSFKGTTTSAPGTWQGPSASINLPATYNAGGTLGGVDVFDNGDGETGTFYPVGLCIRVWDSSFGSTFENATGMKGQSIVFVYTQRSTGVVADFQMVTQPGFNVVPEPSAIALSILGVAGLLLIRRRK
jgi:hypothetical protein